MIRKAININVSLIIFLTLMGFKNETKQLIVKNNIKETLVKKSYTVSEPIELIKSEDFIKNLFAKELSGFYGNKHNCEPNPDGTIYGDINGDNKIDLLTRYTIYSRVEQTWHSAGWLIALSNDKGQLEKFCFFDWSSGRGSRNNLDMGFPISIESGSIYASKDEYADQDASCCPSVEYKIQYTFDTELCLLDGYIVETKHN